MADAPKARIARMTGTFLVPGISKNKRLYTKANIAAAVEAMQTRLADPNGRPITMFSHHLAAAEDNTAAVAGHVTAVTYDPATGRATYEADIADNDAGRNIVALAQPDDTGRRHLKNQSIRGWWNGPVESKVVDGQQVTTSDELEVDGIDFTHNPGIDEAGIATLIMESVQREAGARPPIVEESGEAQVETATEAAAADLLKALQEAYAAVTVDNGPADLRISGWGCAPADLPALVAKLAGAATAALAVLDPDNDGDIDGIDSGDGDVALVVLPESAPAGGSTEAAPASTTATAGKEPEVATENSTTETAPTNETSALTAESVAELIKSSVAEALKAAGVKPAEETAPTTEAAAGAEATNSEKPVDPDALLEAVKAQVMDQVREELLERGIRPDRKGLVRQVAESTEDIATKIKEGKATREEMDAYATQAWDAVFSGIRG